jgi:O-antigen/teichoic acid export membrane protein
MADTTTAGFYSVASRVAIVVLFVMNGAQMVVAPLLAAAAGSGQAGELRQIVRTLNGLSLLAAIPAALILIAAAGPILGLFGVEFREAAPALRLLAVAQLLNVLTGPTGMVLSMTGHERSLVRLLLAGLVLNVVLNVVWIPVYGAAGAALASLLSHLAWNLMAVVVVRARLGLDITPFDLLRRASRA